MEKEKVIKAITAGYLPVYRPTVADFCVLSVIVGSAAHSKRLIYPHGVDKIRWFTGKMSDSGGGRGRKRV